LRAEYDEVVSSFSFNFNLRRYSMGLECSVAQLLQTGMIHADPHEGGGLHSFTLEINLSTFETHSCVELGYVGHKDS
jgi:hypothetical protein